MTRLNSHFFHLGLFISLVLSRSSTRGDVSSNSSVPDKNLTKQEKYSLLENPLLHLNLSEVKTSTPTPGEHQSDSRDIQIMKSPIPDDFQMTNSTNQVLHFVVQNVGKEGENISVDVQDAQGVVKNRIPSPFYLPSGSSKDIGVEVVYPENKTVSHSLDVITIDAKTKEGRTVKRSAYYYYPGSDFEYSSQYQPFCYDRYVTGNCRYRADPYNCDEYKWTAYATIQSSGGIQQLRSIPEGLYIPPDFQPGTRDRIRVYLTVSCCIPIVQFISVNPYHPNVGNACIVDVRELQGLHPGEIAGICLAAVAFLIILIIIVTLLIRQKRNRSVLVGHTASTTTRARESTSRERE